MGAEKAAEKDGDMPKARHRRRGCGAFMRTVTRLLTTGRRLTAAFSSVA
jgi:hypothetical protein